MTRAGTTRATAAVRALYGLVLLTRTRTVLARVHGLPGTPLETTVMRVLGARQVGQALLTLARPTPFVVQAGRITDLAHGASMVGLAALDPARRRAGVVEATTASAFAAASQPG